MSKEFKYILDNYGRTSEERAEAMKLIDQINREAADNWENEAWRKEMAAVLTQSILEGFTFETFYDQVINVDRVGFNDRVILEEETGLKVFFIAKGGHIEASAMVSEAMELPRDTLGFHVYEFEDKMEANFAKSAATLRGLAVRRLDWGVNKQIKALIEAAIPDGSSPYYVTGTSVDQTALNTAIREVRDESESRCHHRVRSLDDGRPDRGLHWIRRRSSRRDPYAGPSRCIPGRVDRSGEELEGRRWRFVHPSQRDVRHGERLWSDGPLRGTEIQGVRRGRQLVLALPGQDRLRWCFAPPGADPQVRRHEYHSVSSEQTMRRGHPNRVAFPVIVHMKDDRRNECPW